MYEIFEHTADLGLRVRAPTLSQLFEDSARGMFSMMVANLDDVRPVHERTYHLVGDQLDYLLFDWLSELLYTFETEQLLLSSFEIEVERGELRAECRGEPLDFDRHRADHEVKAVTYHRLVVEQDEAGQWFAEVIVDI